jgi:hypothetical protein
VLTKDSLQSVVPIEDVQALIVSPMGMSTETVFCPSNCQKEIREKSCLFEKNHIFMQFNQSINQLSGKSQQM